MFYVPGQVLIAKTFLDILQYHPEAVTSDLLRSELLQALLDFLGLDSQGNLCSKDEPVLDYNPWFVDHIKALLKKYTQGPAYRPQTRQKFGRNPPPAEADKISISLKDANITTREGLLDFLRKSSAVADDERDALIEKIKDVWAGENKSDRVTRQRNTAGRTPR